MVISKVISWIADKLGLTEEQEQPEEIGMKAEQADKKPEDFVMTNGMFDHVDNHRMMEESIWKHDRSKRCTYRLVWQGRLLGINQRDIGRENRSDRQ